MRSQAGVFGAELFFVSVLSRLPFIQKEMITNGTRALKILGMNAIFMISSDVIRPAIQSIVVVTSPMVVQAPPAFAAITIIDANSSRSSFSILNFDSRETITMAVVKLSSIDDIKNVIQVITHNSERLDLTPIRLVIRSNPSCASMSSTMVIAPSRKKSIPEKSPTCSRSCRVISCLSGDART